MKSSMFIEEWRDIAGYEGLYQVSNLGRVRSLDRYVKHYKGGVSLLKGNYVNIILHKGGYYRVHLSKDGVAKHHLVHRLVAEAFIPNPENKPQIDHINTCRWDNAVWNLKWVTRKEQYENPYTQINLANCQKGEKSYWYGRKSPRRRPVLQYTIDGVYIKEWDCLTDIRKELGISDGNICRCCKGKLKSAGGYKWSYK